MSAGIWAELIKQGFQNFRHGMTQLTNGYGNIANATASGKQTFNPVGGGGGAQLQTDTSGLFTQGLLQKPKGTSAVGDEIDKQVTEQPTNNYGVFGNEAHTQITQPGESGSVGIFGHAADEEIKNGEGGGGGLFDFIRR